MTDPRAELGARNNADLHEAVFATHGLRFERRAEGFAALDPPPPFYGHGVVTRPGGIGVLLAHLRDRFGCRLAIKDSFAELDPAAEGLRVLFEASWIWRAPAAPTPGGWSRVTSQEALAAWEAAWKRNVSTGRRMFPASFLDRPGIGVFAAWHGTEVIAGCIANRSEDAVGLSNVFGDAPESFARAAAAAGSLAPALPVVGYESGPDLECAIRAGFAPVDMLRILVAA